MKRILTLILSLAVIFSPCKVLADPGQGMAGGPGVFAEGAVLLEANYGEFLYEKNSNKKLYPASTTKILTALLALENGDMNEIVTVGNEISLVDKDGSRAMLVKGEKINLGDLVRGLMLPSGNDAAYSIAVHIARKLNKNDALDIDSAIRFFIKLMNSRAKEIGAADSNFTNPHGFHDINHYSTAHDLAVIAREAMKHEFFREVVGTQQYKLTVFVDEIKVASVTHNWENRNELIKREGRYYYRYAEGIKTGFTTPAGYCLVSSAKKDNLSLIAVVLKDSPGEQWNDSKNLLEYGFNNFTIYDVVKMKDPVTTVEIENPLSYDRRILTLFPDSDFRDLFSKDELSKIKRDIIWDHNVLYPVGDNAVHVRRNLDAGESIARVIYSLNGSVIAESDLVTLETVKKDNRTVYIMGVEVPTVYLLGGAAIIVVFIAGILIGRYKRYHH